MENAALRAYGALVAGLGLQAAVYKMGAELPSVVASLLGLVSAGFLVFGCAVVAQRKGYSPWVGMAGLLSAAGVVVVVLLPTIDAFPRPWRRSALPDSKGRPAGTDPRNGGS
ncbi:MAG: hypothetical protein H5U40_05325 [Polyangiaceae bacterium]|nr:hypothetical protein [Polyangiaceae bacterium]